MEKIRFFKKIWYSIAKPSQYVNLRKEGVGKAFKYIFTIIAILALILGIIATFIQLNLVNDSINYLEEKLPEIKFKNNVLNLENEEAVILDDEKFIGYFGNAIVINPLIEKQDAIDQYKDLAQNKNKAIIFLKEEYIIISKNYNSESKEGIEEHKYSDVSSKLIKDINYEYGKNDVLNYLKQRTTFTYYIAQYFVIFLGTITLLYVFYILISATALWIVTKISKIKWTYKEALMNTIYASTLSIFIYVLYIIISYFTSFRISIMDIISIFLIFIYLYLVLYKEKTLNNSN